MDKIESGRVKGAAEGGRRRVEERDEGGQSKERKV